MSFRITLDVTTEAFYLASLNPHDLFVMEFDVFHTELYMVLSKHEQIKVRTQEVVSIDQDVTCRKVKNVSHIQLDS